MAVLLQDDFNRANNTGSPGSPAVGGPYTPNTGTWGISANQLYLSSTTSPANYLLVPGASDVDFTATLPLAQSGLAGPHSGIVWRALDAANNINISRASTGTFNVSRVIAAVATQISAEFLSLAGDVVRVVCYGRFMWLYHNSILIWTQEDTRYDPANNTKIGFRNGQVNSGRWDSALAIDATADPTSWGASPAMGLKDVVDLSLDSTYAPISSIYKGRDTALADESEIP